MELLFEHIPWYKTNWSALWYVFIYVYVLFGFFFNLCKVCQGHGGEEKQCWVCEALVWMSLYIDFRQQKRTSWDYVHTRGSIQKWALKRKQKMLHCYPYIWQIWENAASDLRLILKYLYGIIWILFKYNFQCIVALWVLVTTDGFLVCGMHSGLLSRWSQVQTLQPPSLAFLLEVWAGM